MKRVFTICRLRCLNASFELSFYRVLYKVVNMLITTKKEKQKKLESFFDFEYNHLKWAEV